MKYVWESHDITCGRRVQSAHRPSEIYMIGYNPLVYERKIALISLNDGMIAASGKTKREMADDFNSNGMRPIDIRLDDIGPKS